MAGHSHSKNVASIKNERNKIVSKTFTNISRLIRSSIKEYGTDLTHPKIKNILLRAKEAGFPKANINKILSSHLEIKNKEKILYSAYGPGNAPMIIECLTENKNRTVSILREILKYYFGKLEDCKHIFKEEYLIIFSADLNEVELLTIIEYGAKEILNIDKDIYAIFDKTNLNNIANTLPFNQKIIFIGMGWIKKYPIEISDINYEKLLELKYRLLNEDDIEEVWV